MSFAPNLKNLRTFFMVTALRKLLSVLASPKTLVAQFSWRTSQRNYKEN